MEWVVTFVAYYLISREIKQRYDEYVQGIAQFVTGVVDFIKPKVDKNTGILRRMVNQVIEYPLLFAGLLYHFSAVRCRKDLIANLSILASALKISDNIKDIVLAKVMSVNPTIQGEEEMLEEVLPVLAMGMTLTNTQIGDVNLSSFIQNTDRNYKACEHIISKLTPLLVKCNLIQDSAYELILEVAKQVKSLSEEEIWVRTTLKMNPNIFLQEEGSVRIKNLRTQVDHLLKKLTTLHAKEQRSDKVVVECLSRIRALESLLVDVAVIEQTNTVRVKPVGVAIQGEKQIGKTNLVAILTRRVCEYVENNGGLAFRNAKKWTTWTIQNRDEYDTGYTGQEITYADDAFQQKDNKDHPMWFTFISTSAVGTNQADLKNKGLPYRSKLVIATCNRLPEKSITVEDMQALHARFPHTVHMVRNNKPMPQKDKINESYDWVDMYYGPMIEAVKHVGGGTKTSKGKKNEIESLQKVSLEELVKFIGDDLIIQNKFYESTLLTPVQAGIQGEQQSNGLYYRYTPQIRYQQLDDPLYVKYKDAIVKILNQYRHNDEDNELFNFVKDNLDSFRAYHLLISMKNSEGTFEDWLQQYLEKMVDHVKEEMKIDSNCVIQIPKLKGLELHAAKAILKNHKYIDSEDLEMSDNNNYKTIQEHLIEFLNFEVSFLETDIISVALTKLLLQQIAGPISYSKWSDVDTWVLSLKHKVTGLTFLNHVERYPLTLTQFLLDLASWETEGEITDTFWTQKPLFIKLNNKMYMWSPLLSRGTRLIEVGKRFRDILFKIENATIKSQIDLHDGVLVRRWMEEYIQDGLAVNMDVHSELLSLNQEGYSLPHSLTGRPKVEILWNCLHFRSTPDIQLQGYLSKLEEITASKSTFCKIVAQNVVEEVTASYSKITSYYTNLTRDGMGKLLAFVNRLGIPINEYWENILVSNAPLISASAIMILISLLGVAVVKCLKYGVEGEEQSKGEKRAKQKKISQTRIQKLRLKGGEQAEGDVLYESWTNDIELKFETLENAFLKVHKETNACIFATSNMKLGEANGFCVATEETFDFSFDTPKPPSWKNVSVGRLDGARVIEFEMRGTGDFDHMLREVERMINVSRYFKAASYDIDINFVREHSEYTYHVVLYLSSALIKGEAVPWTRADLKNVQDVEIMFRGGKPVDVQTVIRGSTQANTQSYDTLDVLKRRHMVKICCVKPEDLNNRAMKGVQVYALGHNKQLVLPAHAIREAKWIRFQRAAVEKTEHFGVAHVTRWDYVRDIAVAQILSRSEAETRLVERENVCLSLTTISKEQFEFPSLAKYLLGADETEVEWLNCITLHYFAKNNVVGHGRTTSFEINEYECGPTYIQKKLGACVQGMQTESEMSQKGDCGSPVVLASGKKNGRLLGFHAYLSPAKKTWYSAILTKEDLNVIDGGEEHFKDNWQSLITVGPPTDLPNGPEVEYIGNLVRPSLPVTNDSLDHWHKSPFADQFEEQLAPGRLNPYDPYIETELPRNLDGRKSLILGPNSEMAKKLPELDQSLLDWCVNQLVAEQAEVFKAANSLTKVSDDIDEMLDYALNGHPDNEYVRGMEVNKAAGLPWSLMGTPKKSDFIDVDEQTGKRTFNTKNGSVLRQRVVSKLEQAKLGNRILSFSSSKLKDQPIKIAQAKSGRTRVFHCIPVDLILFSGALYGPYKEAYTKAGLKCFHAVGIDPKSVGWEQLASYMTKHPYYFDADYKNYDKYLHRQVFKAVRSIQRKVIQLVAPDNWDQARAVEELDAIDTYVVDYKTVYKTNRANKSGSYTTTIDNCLANDIYGLYAWVKTTGLKSLYDYRANVSSVAFGDDIIKSVSAEYVDKYNYCTYRDVLNATGHVITPGSKDGEEISTAFENLQFLKRGFVFKDGLVLAPLLKRSIEGPFVWTDLRSDQLVIWNNLVQEQLIEASLWGQEYYDELRSKLKCGTDRHLNEYLVNLLNTSWDVTFQKFVNRYYGLKGRDL
uniref:Nonstructural polyprotein n=1 Tax=Apis Nora virus TaxID=1983571 RepID=A0A1W6R6I6_9VIRU|nr:nonstructural polyprotein [Apis Nora virus]